MITLPLVSMPTMQGILGCSALVVCGLLATELVASPPFAHSAPALIPACQSVSCCDSLNGDEGLVSAIDRCLAPLRVHLVAESALPLRLAERHGYPFEALVVVAEMGD